MKKKIVLIFLVIMCTAFLNAQSLDEMVLTAAVRMSNDLPAGSTVAIVSVSAPSEELSTHVIDGLYGAMLRNRRVTPVKLDQGQAQYAITGSIEVVGSEYRLSFNAVDENSEIKSRYASSSTGTLVMAETGTASSETSSSITGADASSTSSDKTTSAADTSKRGQVLVTFGVGAQSLKSGEDYRGYEAYYGDSYMNTVYGGTVLGVYSFFMGKSGFTISAGVDIIFNTDVGINIDPVIGLGYIYYNKFYVGGILNLTFKPYITYSYTYYSYDDYDWWITDGFIAPTFVMGYDFGGHFLLGLQLSYMIGVMSEVDGFKFSVGAGVNVR